MSLIISDLGWFILFFVNCKTQICKSCLQRHLLATLSLITKQKKEKKKKKKYQNIFASIYREFQLDLLQLHNLQNTNWTSPGLNWDLKLTIFEEKLVFHHRNRKTNIKKAHFAFIVAYYVFLLYSLVCCIEWRELTMPIFLNLWKGKI